LQHRLRDQQEKNIRAEKHLTTEQRALLHKEERTPMQWKLLAMEVELRIIQDANKSILYVMTNFILWLEGLPHVDIHPSIIMTS